MILYLAYSYLLRFFALLLVFIFFHSFFFVWAMYIFFFHHTNFSYIYSESFVASGGPQVLVRLLFKCRDPKSGMHATDTAVRIDVQFGVLAILRELCAYVRICILFSHTRKHPAPTTPNTITFKTEQSVAACTLTDAAVRIDVQFGVLAIFTRALHLDMASPFLSHTSTCGHVHLRKKSI